MRADVHGLPSGMGMVKREMPQYFQLFVGRFYILANKYKELKILFGNNLYFPNSGIAAYCDLRSQLIHLNGLNKLDFDAALRMERENDLRSHLGTMLHEITHWADIVGTLWGQEYLRAVYDGLALLKKTTVNGGEQEFHKFIDLHDRTRRQYSRLERA